MCPGPWLTVTMGELSLCLGTSQHGAPLSRPVTPWLYDSMHDCIMTSDCMMTCDILTPVHGSSWQHTADTHFSCTSEMQIFYFQTLILCMEDLDKCIHCIMENRRSQDQRERMSNVRAGMWMKWRSYHIHVPSHNTLSDMEHVWMTL